MVGRLWAGMYYNTKDWSASPVLTGHSEWTTGPNGLAYYVGTAVGVYPEYIV